MGFLLCVLMSGLLQRWTQGELLRSAHNSLCIRCAGCCFSDGNHAAGVEGVQHRSYKGIAGGLTGGGECASLDVRVAAHSIMWWSKLRIPTGQPKSNQVDAESAFRRHVVRWASDLKTGFAKNASHAAAIPRGY